MGISIAVWGPPGAGKTVVAAKLAHVLSKYNDSVIYASLDVEAPAFPGMFPAGKYTSLGSAISEPSIAPAHIYRAALSVTKNFMALAYVSGEGRNTYPVPTPDKAKNFVLLLNEMANTVIYDCTNVWDDELTRAAMQNSDLIIKVVSPTAKGLSYLSTEKEYLNYHADHEAVCLNLADDYVRYAVDQAAAIMATKSLAILPFARKIREQQEAGTLFTSPVGGKFDKIFLPFVRRSMAIAGVNFDMSHLNDEKGGTSNG